jgi:RNA ligase
MKLNEYVDVAELGQLIDDGFVSARKDNQFPLTVLNYTPKAVSLRPWSQTLCRCRGLVCSEDLDIICTGFSKFWNYGDEANGAGKESLPSGTPRVFEKADGSYLSVFWYKNTLVCNTRGSFASDQAKWANDWIRSHFTKKICSYSERELSFIFEVIIPEDRKVVDYDYSGLVLLGAIDRDGKEYSPECAEHYVSTWLKDYKVVKEYAYEDLETLQAKNIPNEEGYVCTWYQPEGPAFRVKLKFEEYKKLHKLIFNTNSWSIWELTKEGKCVTLILEGATEEIKSWANKLAEDIKKDHDSLKTAYTGAFRTINTLCNGTFEPKSESAFEWNGHPSNARENDKERRKYFAILASKYEHSPLLFLLYDGKLGKFEDKVWELVKPVKSFFRKPETEEP